MKKEICKFILYVIIIILIAGCQKDSCTIKAKNPGFLGEKYPNITFGILASSTLAELPDNIILCFNGERYPAEVIEKRVGLKSIDVEFFRCVENFAEELYIEYYSKKIPGKPEDNTYWALKRHVMDFIAKQVTIAEKEAKEYLDRNSIWFGEYSYEMIADQITNMALDDKKNIIFADHLQEAGKTIPIILSKTWLEKILSGLYDHPLYDLLSNGKKSVVIFSYGCCKPDIMLPEIEILQRYYGNQFNIIHIDSQKDVGITERFRVENNPTTFIFDEKGTMKHILNYHYSAEEIFKKIREPGGDV